MSNYTCCLLLFLLPFIHSNAQTSDGKLLLDNNKIITVTLDISRTITQEAMGKAIDFTARGTAHHSYQVTDSTDKGYELHHEIQRFNFMFDGMGTKRSFDSDNKADLEGSDGAYFKTLLSRSFDVNIDNRGAVISCIPPTLEHIEADEKVAVATNILSDLTSVVEPPVSGSPVFFLILPDYKLNEGDTWKDSTSSETMEARTIYNVLSVTADMIIVNFTTKSTTIAVTASMGIDATSKLNNISTGKITIDKKTNLLVSKTVHTESNGTTEAMGASMPLHGKTDIIIQVRNR